jgi:hypothetical protein
LEFTHSQHPTSAVNASAFSEMSVSQSGRVVIDWGKPFFRTLVSA